MIPIASLQKTAEALMAKAAIEIPEDYLGPAALNRAWTLVNDARDGGNRERLAAVAAGGGCHACHSHQSCQEHCPKALNPTASIAGLKRRTMQAYIRGEL